MRETGCPKIITVLKFFFWKNKIETAPKWRRLLQQKKHGEYMCKTVKLLGVAYSPCFTDNSNFDLSGIRHFRLYLF
jgi:hypothetical protein